MSQIHKYFSLILVLLTIAGCSSGKSALIPPNDNELEIPISISSNKQVNGNRHLLGIWNLSFNSETLEATVTPSRLANTHYQVKHLIPTPEVVVNTIYPNYVIDADITLTNPFLFDAYDVRLIIFTDDENHRLENPDCWTAIYDIPEGLPINPFKAYAKDEPNRIFAGETNHTENLLAYFPPGSHPFQFAVDASFPANCEEPYEISNFQQVCLTETPGSTANAIIHVKDWQDDVDSVSLFCSSLSSSEFEFTYYGDNKWKGTLVNENGMQAGEYQGSITASSSNSGSLLIYNNVIITVGQHADTGWILTWDVIGNWGHTKITYITTDENGDLYVLGKHKYSMDLNPGPGENILPDTVGGDDMFLVKLNRNGEYIWGLSWLNNIGYNYPKAMIASETGDIYITGYFTSSIDLDPGTGVDIYTPSNDKSNAFLLKLDLNGNYQWGFAIGGSDYVRIMDMVTDNNGELILAGYFSGTADFDPGTGTEERTAVNSIDNCLCKFNSDGEFQSVIAWNQYTQDGLFHLAIDHNDNLFASGYCVPPSGRGAVLYKLDSAFNQLWHAEWTTNSCGYYYVNVEVDQAGNPYVTGSFPGTVDFDPGPDVENRTSYLNSWDPYLVKLDTEGNFQWVVTNGTYLADYSSSISIDSFGNIYNTGDTYNHDVESYASYFTKIDTNGEYDWCHYLIGDVCIYDIIADDLSGCIYLVGYYKDSADFKPGPEEYILTAEDYTAFCLKINSDGYW